MHSQTISVDEPRALFAAIVTLVASSLYLVTLAVVIGNFADGLQLNEAQLGAIFSVFMLGFTLSTISGYWWIRRWNWRRTVVAGAVLGAVTFLAPAVYIDYSFLMVMQLGAGIFSGVVYSVAFTALCDNRHAERALALGYGSQALVGFSVTSVMPTGPDAYTPTLYILAAGLAACILVLGLLPQSGSKTGVSGTASNGNVRIPRILVFAALSVVLIPYMSEVSAVTFLSEIGRSKDLSREVGQNAAAYSQLASFAGSMLAAYIGMRFGRIKPMAAGLLASLTAMFVFKSGAGANSFMLASLLFMAGFGFCAPYRLALAADVDIEGRFTTWAVSAQTIAGIIGPGISGALIVGVSYDATYLMWIGFFIAGFAIYAWVCRRFASIHAVE